jgi:hypothetical protein
METWQRCRSLHGAKRNAGAFALRGTVHPDFAAIHPVTGYEARAFMHGHGFMVALAC